ncbi:hypothetical protein GQ53DRAFT_665922, partial [Thozetella sp. PMI_491]
MDPLSIAASIAGVLSLADTVFDRVMRFAKWANTVKNSAAEIRELGNEVNLLAGTLHSLRALAATLELEDQFDTTFRMHHISSCSRLLRDIDEKLAKAASDPAKSVQQRGWMRLKWPYTSSETKQLLEEVSRHQGHLRLALSADTMNAMLKCLASQNEIRDAVHQVSDAVQSVKRALELERRVRMSRERQRVVDFFLKVNPQSYFETNRKLRHPLTGLWLTHILEFQNWLSVPGSKLWLSGIPGAGKTVLASTVIEEAISRSSDSNAVGFFFCDYRNVKTQSIANILGALAAQIAMQKPEAFEMLQQFYDELHSHSAGNLDGSLTEEGLSGVLRDMAELFDRVYLIADGLDECGDTTNHIVKSLSSLGGGSNAISIALLTRNEPDIRDRLHTDFVEIEISAHSSDVKEYVSAELEERIRTNRLRVKDLQLKGEILQTLVEGAHGMFRWVVCQLDHLCLLRSDRARREALAKLPDGLTDTYMRILERASRSDRVLVQTTLQILAFADPPMTIGQLCQLLSFSDDDELDESALIVEDEIARSCSSLVRKSADGRCFEFAHFSVREFLGSDVLRNPGAGHNVDLACYAVSASSYQKFIATQSLRFLQLDRCSIPPDEAIQNAVKWNQWAAQTDNEFPFYRVAVHSWIKNARDRLDDPEIWELVKGLFDPKKTASFVVWAISLQSWLSTFLRPRQSLDPGRKDFQPLHMAAALGLPAVCSYLLENRARVDLKSAMGSPVQCAAGGPTMLLDTGLPRRHDAELPMIYEWTGWEATDATETLECLLHDSDRLPPDLLSSTAGGTPASLALHSSIYLESFEPFITLHSKGADFTMEHVDAFRAVIWRWEKRRSLESSFSKLVQYLNPLIEHVPAFALCSLVWEKAVVWGLKFARNPSAVDTRISLSDQRFPLELRAAVEADDIDELAKLLKDPRLSVEHLEDSKEEPLLHIAVLKSSARVVAMLLDAGCSLEQENSVGHRPMQVILWRYLHTLNDTREILRLLLARGASTTVQDKGGFTIWFTSNSDLLRALLETENPEKLDQVLGIKNNRGDTVLQSALRSGHKEIVSTLLEHRKPSHTWLQSVRVDEHDARWKCLEDTISVMIDLGFMDEYETTSGSAGLLPLLDAISDDGFGSAWPLTLKSMSHMVSKTKHLSSFVKSPAAVRLLKS